MMTFNAVEQNRHAVVEVGGDITQAVSAELEERLLGMLSLFPYLVLDCSRIGLLSSAGLRTLLVLYREARTRGRKLVLAAVPEAVRDVMTVTGFWDQFVVYGTVDEAIAAAS